MSEWDAEIAITKALLADRDISIHDVAYILGLPPEVVAYWLEDGMTEERYLALDEAISEITEAKEATT